MALTLASKTVQNITVVTGTVSGGAGGSASAVIFDEPGGFGIGRGGFVERFRIKVIRLVAPGAVAKDSVSLTDLGTITDANRGFIPDSNSGDATFLQNPVWEATMGTGPFEDQTNLGDEFRNGLRISATTAAVANDTNLGYVFRLFLYHGLS
jgi:hypothetical protein